MIEISPNIKVKVVKDNKFKHIDISFKFVKNFIRDDMLTDYVLGEILGEYSETYQTKLEMARRKDELYGLNVYSYQDILCDHKIFNLTYHFLDPYYVDTNIQEYFEFIRETLTKPFFSTEILDEILYNYDLKIARILDKPQRLATNQLIKIIGKDNHLKNKDIDNRYLIKDMTLDKVIEGYKNLINNSTIYIYAIGDIDEDSFIDYFKDIFSGHQQYINYQPKKISLVNYDDIIEDRKISQSYLKIVYETDYSNVNEDYYKWLIADAMLGAIPDSLLFKEVREKRSLCYTISSGILKPEGLCIVSSAISFSTYKEIVELTDKCIKMLVEKNYDYRDLEITKKILINSLNANSDDARNVVDFIHSNEINNKNYTIKDITDMIAKVSVDDVSEVMKTYKRRLVYVLRGDENAEN